MKLVTKFEQLGHVSEGESPVRPRSVRSTGNIEAVAASVTEDLGMFIPRRSQQIYI